MRVTGEKRATKYDVKRSKSMPVAYNAMVAERRPDIDKLSGRAAVDEKVAGVLLRHGIAGGRRIDYQNFARAIERSLREGTLTPDKVNGFKDMWTRAYGCDGTILDEIVKALTGAE